MDNLKVMVKHFLDRILYSNKTNKEKTIYFKEILDKIDELNNDMDIGSNEKEYILVKIYDVAGEIDFYNTPVINNMCTRFINAFNTYYCRL